MRLRFSLSTAGKTTFMALASKATERLPKSASDVEQCPLSALLFLIWS
jgi:hypothetical protein